MFLYVVLQCNCNILRIINVSNFNYLNNHNSAGTTLGTTFEKNSNSVTVVFDIKCLSDVKNMDHK